MTSKQSLSKFSTNDHMNDSSQPTHEENARLNKQLILMRVRISEVLCNYARVTEKLKKEVEVLREENKKLKEGSTS